MSIRAIVLAVVLLSPVVAHADPAPNNLCIRDPDIVSETRPDDYTILFNMRDHTVWKNTMPTRCFGLRNETQGFTYQPTDPTNQELCSNQVTIKLNTFHSFCLLGNFTRIK